MFLLGTDDRRFESCPVVRFLERSNCNAVLCNLIRIVVVYIGQKIKLKHVEVFDK
jgi:hypothetical protein